MLYAASGHLLLARLQERDQGQDVGTVSDTLKLRELNQLPRVRQGPSRPVQARPGPSRPAGLWVQNLIITDTEVSALDVTSLLLLKLVFFFLDYCFMFTFCLHVLCIVEMFVGLWKKELALNWPL